MLRSSSEKHSSLSAHAALAFATLLFVSGCGGGGGGSATTPPPIDPASGLDQRPDNTTCVAPDRATSGAGLSVARVFTNLTFTSPIAMLQAPGDASRWFVVEQGGRVRVFPNQSSVSAFTPFVDISGPVVSGGEQGLLGMAFHPDFPANPRVYLSYTTGSGQLVSRVSEFRTTDNGVTLDPATERVLLVVNQPESNHNGGHIAFGADGFLYIGFGDGGGGGDDHGTIGNGQNPRTLLGKLLRIDVNVSSGLYGIPGSNPFSGGAQCGVNGTGAQTCPEIFASGFRNPWRWNFDRDTQDLWLADVGQGAWEEVNRVTIGGNYGWRCREGAHDYPPGAVCGSPSNLISPVAEYSHSAGVSITGGYVYRGSAMPSLVGRYFFGDFGSGNIWNIARDSAPTLQVTAGQALDSGLSISSFGQGEDGELYVVDYNGGLYRLQQSGGSGGGAVPAQLSATGCVSTADAKLPASGLIPYKPNAPFWSDTADKDRWMALPNGQRIVVNTDGDWDFPNGAVLVKNFRLGQRLIETRLFMRHPDGVWAGYSYEWNTAQTDATRVVGGKTVVIDGVTWIYPSESECLICHTEAAGRSLGLETAQLNGDFTYPQTGRTANQVVTLNAIDVLTPRVTQAPGALPVLRDPQGTAGTLNDRARAYLHTNCSQCHRPGGMGADIDLRATTALNATATCNVAPQAGDLGLSDPRIIATGDAARSVLVARMNRRDGFAMPPLASSRVDDQGVALITSWINALTSCN